MRRGPVVLALAALPLAAGACGGGGKSSTPTVTLTPVAYVKQAAKKTSDAPSEHMTLAGSVAAGGQTVTLDGAGDFDNASRAGAMHLSFAVGGMSGSIDELLTGRAVYMKSPLFSSVLPGGKTWLKIDLGKALAAHGISLSTLTAQSPSESLSQLLASTDATKVGTEAIDGASTTHYRGTIDFAHLPQAARMPGLAKATAPFDVWVDDSTGYVRRVKLAYSISAASVAMTMDFSNFGEAVTAQAPPAADTYDATNSALKGLTP